MKTETKLAKVFTTIATEGGRLESTAAGVLAIVKDAGINDVEAFDEAVKAAYAANGWNQTAGRPSPDSKAESVPDTVRTYVSWIRSALREGLRVSRFETFQELRNALAKKRGIRVVKKTANGGARVPKDLAHDFEGIEIAGAQPNGAVMHDLALVFIKLPPDDRALLGRQLNRLAHTWLPKAFPQKTGGRKAAVASG